MIRSPLIVFFLSTVLPGIAAGGPIEVHGVVVDQSGRAVARAYVRTVTKAQPAAAGQFTDSDGRFRLSADDAAGGCRVEVTLAGFQTTDAPCRAGEEMKITLGVSPVEQSVVVTATRTETPTGQLGAAATVFSSADIERRQQPPVADLLRTSPGVAVIRNGGAGSITSVFVRGGESSYSKVLLDGIPLNEPGGTFNFNNVTSENLERVEIVRGANSALYGSDAMTSVVQLFTRRGDGSTGRPVVTLRGEGGTYSTARGAAELSGAAGRFDYSAAIASLTTDNRVPNDVFRNTTLSANGGVELGLGARLRFVGRRESGRTGVPGPTAYGRPDMDASFSRHDGVGGVTFEQRTGDFEQRGTYGLAVSHQASTNLQLDPPYTPRFKDHVAPFQFSDFLYNDHTDLRRHHASYQADWTLRTASAGQHIETALVDWDGERGTLGDLLAGTAIVARRDNVGVSLQHQALWARLFASAGVRLEHNASFGGAAVPKGAVAYYARTGNGTIGTTRLKASAGLGIKEPTLLQSFSPNPGFKGNPDLEPEKARTLDAGIEQRLFGDRASVEATWFDNRFRDIISTRTISFNPFQSQYFNIGLTRARGAEIAADVAPASSLRLRGGYTFTDSRILESTSPTSPVFKAGQWAFRRPRHAGYLDAAWNYSRYSVAITGSFVGRRVDSDFSSLQPALLWNDGVTYWALRSSARVTRQLTWTLAVDNVANAPYMEPLGFVALGRAVRTGAKVTF